MLSCRVQREQLTFHRNVTTNDGEKDICLGIEHMLTDNIEINVEFYHFVSQL